jgi:hypothetical protein
LLTDDRPPEQPEQPLPPAVVNYRNKVIDLYWDPERYLTWGDGDWALSARTFIGKCPLCGDEVEVKFREREANCWLECASGCEEEHQDEFLRSFESAFYKGISPGVAE